MKVKIFKCIMNGENAVESTLHGTMKAAVVAANQFIETFGEGRLKWYDTLKELEASIGKIQRYWNDEDWGVFFTLYIGQIQNSGILGINTVAIEAEEIEVVTATSLYSYSTNGNYRGTLQIVAENLACADTALINFLDEEEMERADPPMTADDWELNFVVPVGGDIRRFDGNMNVKEGESCVLDWDWKINDSKL